MTERLPGLRGRMEPFERHPSEAYPDARHLWIDGIVPAWKFGESCFYGGGAIVLASSQRVCERVLAAWSHAPVFLPMGTVVFALPKIPRRAGKVLDLLMMLDRPEEHARADGRLRPYAIHTRGADESLAAAKMIRSGWAPVWVTEDQRMWALPGTMQLRQWDFLERAYERPIVAPGYKPALTGLAHNIRGFLDAWDSRAPAGMERHIDIEEATGSEMAAISLVSVMQNMENTVLDALVEADPPFKPKRYGT